MTADIIQLADRRAITAPASAGSVNAADAAATLGAACRALAASLTVISQGSRAAKGQMDQIHDGAEAAIAGAEAVIAAARSVETLGRALGEVARG